ATPYRLGHPHGVVAIDSVQQRTEFVAAEAGEDITAAQLLADQPGNLADQGVSGRMSAGVVDDLELIEIEVEQRVGGGRDPLIFDGGGDARLEFTAILQSRQRVMSGLVLEACTQGRGRALTASE